MVDEEGHTNIANSSVGTGGQQTACVLCCTYTNKPDNTRFRHNRTKLETDADAEPVSRVFCSVQWLEPVGTGSSAEGSWDLDDKSTCFPAQIRCYPPLPHISRKRVPKLQ